jgi:hypothetical protein
VNYVTYSVMTVAKRERFTYGGKQLLDAGYSLASSLSLTLGHSDFKTLNTAVSRL